MLGETLPRYTQRLYRLLGGKGLKGNLGDRLMAAEEAIYQDSRDPMVNWDAADLQRELESVGFRVEVQVERSHQELQITSAMLDRWFSPSKSEKPSYGDRLAQQLSGTEVQAVAEAFQRHLLHQTVQWESAVGFICATLEF